MLLPRRTGYGRSAKTFLRKWVTPKACWHMLEVWPELRLESAKTPFSGRWQGFYNGQSLGHSAPIAEWRNAWADDAARACYLVGSGPSMRQQNLHRLQAGRVVLLNGALSLIDSHAIQPAAVVIVDYRFVRDRGELLADIPPKTPCFFTPAVIRAVCDRNPQFFKERPWYVLDNALRPYGQPCRSWQELGEGFVLDDADKPQAAFSLDLATGFVDARTVMYAACQLAVYAGSRAIHLVGFDIGNARQPRFNETDSTRLKSRLDRAYESRILPAMRLFARICQDKGIDCFNHSPVSRLPATVIPRSDTLNQ